MLQPVTIRTKKFALLKFINKLFSSPRSSVVSNLSNFFVSRQMMAVELHRFTFEAAPFADISTKKILYGFVVNKCPLLVTLHIK